MDSQVIAAIVGLVGALIGSAITYKASASAKKVQKMESRIDELKREVSARQDQEEEVCAWLCELEICKSENAAKLQLRDRVELNKGSRPTMSRSSVRS